MSESAGKETIVICKNCALMLARIAYRRRWWFPLVREPLVLGMRMLAVCNGIDARRHAVRNQECKGCIRFMKAELEEKSATFRFLNDRIGDYFITLRNSLLTQEELDEAKRFARQAMEQEHENGHDIQGIVNGSTKKLDNHHN